MTRKFIRVLAILAILIISIGITGAAFAKPAGEIPVDVLSAPVASSRWFTGWADKNTSAHIGAYPSIAYNPANGLPYISYYDADNGHLMLASPVNSGGNCGDSNRWYCRVVDGNGVNGSSSDSVGQASSIAFWKGTALQGWKLGISYHDATTHALKLALWTQPAFSAGTWTFSTISSTSASVHSGNDIGTSTSVKFSNTGRPYIAYYSHLYSTFSSAYVGTMYIANAVTSGGNCGVGTDDAGKWQCTQILWSNGAGFGQSAYLDLGYNNVPYMAFYDAGNADLWYAHYAGPAGGNCFAGSDYDCKMIDGSGADVGSFAAIKAPISSTDKVRIAYYDKTHGNLKYATPVTSGGNCGSGSWQCNMVHSMGAGLTQAGISMALDKSGYPIIAYEDASADPGPSMLSIARPASAYDNPIGNCGEVPPGYTFYYWQCNTLDNAGYGQGYVNLAFYTSVAVSPSGLASIAYLESDDYNTTDYLKVATQRLQVYLPLIKR